ncbi:pantothenate kinase 3 isoform X2 [Lepeophtheirus salmonis]|uniref:pantothenate kinase 3 isoform X2 n=1 Tax=Lepeophtheirus salmonis TaxID=72036 RepID=UPI003AF3AAF1
MRWRMLRKCILHNFFRPWSCNINILQVDSMIPSPMAFSGEYMPPMPWFGMDIGGTLTKLVYFEPEERVEPDSSTLSTIRRYLLMNKAYGEHGHRDIYLQIDSAEIGGKIGTLHFIRFPTSEVNSFIELAKAKGMASMASTICATGGGAYKFEKDFKENVNMTLNKFDELNSLVRGIQYIRGFKNNELFYIQDHEVEGEDSYTNVSYTSQSVYPFLLVNIGSGVSILSVTGPETYRRVYGTSLGGGTFFGLCCLLTDCSSFEDAMELASRGDNTRVDKLVKDIYGGNYEKFGLSGETVASSFGQMNSQLKRKDASKEDLARACLVTITNNIGSIARLCAKAENIERVLFVGNFLRINTISMKLLSSAMKFWSGGSIEALFCKHEGYFGAVGCLLELMKTHR